MTKSRIELEQDLSLMHGSTFEEIGIYLESLDETSKAIAMEILEKINEDAYAYFTRSCKSQTEFAK